MNKRYSEINIKTQEDYFERVNYQIDWLDRKSVIYKRVFMLIKILIMVFASSITIISALGALDGTISQNTFIAVIVLAPTIAFFESLLQLLRFEKLHYEYRMTSEMLKGAKVYYQTRTNCADINENFLIFVSTYENLLHSNNLLWYQIKNKTEAGSRS